MEHAVVSHEPEELPGKPEPDFLTRDWSSLVLRIRNREDAAMEELYAVFSRGIRYFLLRSLGPEDLDDKVHDCFVVVVQAIQSGHLREPERLMGFVRTVVKRQIAGCIDVAVNQRRNRADFDDIIDSVAERGRDPERAAIAHQRAETARKVLDGVSRRDRDILQRFYVAEQSQEQICAEMGLTYNQFRLLKCRAKARFGALGKQIEARTAA